MAVLSRFPIQSSKFVMFENPKLEIKKLIDGKYIVWKSHDKGFLQCNIGLEGHYISFFSSHFFPFHEFGKDAIDYQNIYVPLLKSIEEAGLNSEVIVAADLNIDGFSNLKKVLPGIANTFRSVSELPTRWSGKCHDYILYRGSLELIEYHVLRTFSDHHYLQATFDIES